MWIWRHHRGSWCYTSAKCQPQQSQWSPRVHKSKNSICHYFHWEKFFTREMKVRMDVVDIQSQLVVQIENFAFLNEIQWLEWAHQSNAQFVLQNEMLVVMTIPNPNIRICDCYRNLYVKLNFRFPKGILSVVILICALTAVPKVGLGMWS